MILHTSKEVKRFVSEHLPKLTKTKAGIIPRLITSILMSCGDPHFSRIGKQIASETRHRATIMKFFKGKRYKSRDEYRRALNSMVRSYKRLCKGTWFIVLDGVSMQRGGFTMIKNAIQYKEKTSKQKGKSTKAHMFLMGALLLPDGSRLPLTRKTYYTKDYCRETGKKFVSIVQLASEMIKEAPIPEKQKVYVLADEFFEGSTIHEVCKQLSYFYIMPVDSRRCFTDKHGNRISETLYTRGQSIKRTALKKIQFVSGQEETASYRRISESNRKKKRVYHAYAEVRGVSGLGDVLVTYSHKQKYKKGKKSGESFRVFVSNDKSLSAKQTIEYYELRWQIEIFFRELKSTIGIDRFRGGDFMAFERYIDTILMGVLFLESYRLHLIDEEKSRKQKSKMKNIRIHGLTEKLRADIEKEGVDYLVKISRKKSKAELEKTLQFFLQAA